MTRPRFDEHSTEFGLWLRKQPEIESKKGYVATNIDFLWANYKNGFWMLLEEKRHGGKPTKSQIELFTLLDGILKRLGQYGIYKGFHYLIFERTNPDDGKMWLDGDEITIRELLDFLTFSALEFRYSRRFEIEKMVG